MFDINEIFDLMEQEPNGEVVGEHGKLIEYRFEPYYDVKVYEDGYEDWYYIGD